MVLLLCLVVVLAGTLETGQTAADEDPYWRETQSNGLLSTPSIQSASASRSSRTEPGKLDSSSVSHIGNQHMRFSRGSKDRKLKHKEQQGLHNQRHPRPFDPEGYFTTPRVFNGSLLVHNPLYPVTGSSYGAYAVLLLSLLVFAVGVVGNLSVMCIVWNNYYLKNTWNCVLASMAFWDFLLLFFCLPVVVFNELTKRRLLGDLSCRIVPYVEVASLGVFTFSLCALSIDRFHRVTAAPSRPQQQQQVESCGSILAKLSVVWLGSLLLATPELLLWQLDSEVSAVSGLPVDSCARRPSIALPEAVYSLVLTYHEARMWWIFGCFFCLPLIFSLACHLLTSHVVEETARQTRPSLSSSSSSSSSSLKKRRRGQRDQLSRMLTMLMAVYGVCGLPEHAWTIGLAYAGLQVSKVTLALLSLIGQFLLFAQAAATPMLILLASRSLGRNFMDCCCCCCEECLPDPASSSASSVSSTTTATALSSCPSPPVSVNEEKLQIVSGTTPPSVFFDKVKDSSAEMAIGTPC